MRSHSKPRPEEWRDGFVFLGNQLFLDFLNTYPILDSGQTELLPDFASLLRWFRAADLLTPNEQAKLQRDWGGSARAERILHSLTELRERVRKEVLHWEQGGKIHDSAVTEFNALLATHPMRTRLKVNNGNVQTELYFEPREPEDLFAPLAQSAAELFTTADYTRVRKCDHCVGHFLDISKKGTRRWCSMKLCGNRHKVAAYAARQRLSKDA